MNLTQIQHKLSAVRGRIRSLLAARALLTFLVCTSLLVMFSFGMDWIFHLPWGARLLLLLTSIGVMCWGALRYSSALFTLGLEDEDLALLVQQRRPEYRDDLITALQFSRRLNQGEAEESPELMAGTVAAILERFRNDNFKSLFRFRPLARVALGAAGGLMLVAILTAARPDDMALWAERCLLLSDRQWPAETTLEVRLLNLENFRNVVQEDGSQDVYVPEGTVLRVEVEAIGVVPAAVQILRYKMPRKGNNHQKVELAANDEHALFEYKFGRVTQSFAFCVNGGDDQDSLPYFRIHVRSAPRIDALEVNYNYPTYINDTGKDDRKGAREYNVVGPKGTEVEMLFRSSSPLREFVIDLDEGKELIQLEASGDDPLLYRWSFRLEDDHFYSYRLAGENGAPSREAPRFNISAQPDLPPQIGVILPETTSLDVSAKATRPIKMRLADDYGIGDAEILWDTQRDGKFENVIPLEGEQLRLDEERREGQAFLRLDLADLKILDAKTGQMRNLQAGESLFLRIRAKDTRATELNPEPNVANYGALLVLNVRENVEVERELMRSQVRFKDQVVRLEESVAKLNTAWEVQLKGHGKFAQRDWMHNEIAAHALVTTSLNETSRGFVRIFDGYLLNRLDPSKLTEDLIFKICARHAKDEGNHYDFIKTILKDTRLQFDDSETMGKLAFIMDLLMTAAAEDSQLIARALKESLSASDPKAGQESFVKAKKGLEELHNKVLLLSQKMVEWEDFQDVIQSLKDIIELEKGLWERMKKAAK